MAGVCFHNQPNIPARRQLQRIARSEHLPAFGSAVFFAGLLAAQSEVDALARDLPISDREGFGQHKLAWQTKDVVDEAWSGLRRIFLDRQHPSEATPVRAAHLDRVEPEAQPPIGNMMA